MTNQILSNNNAASNVFAQTFGTTSTSVFVIQLIDRNPTSQDVQFPIRQKWVNTTTDEEWILESFTSSNGVVTANWSKTGSGIFTIEALEGNTGGPVNPDANHIVHTIGATPYTVTGNPSTNTLTWSDNGTIAYSYPCNIGTAIPSANVLNVFGANGIQTTGSGNTITIVSGAYNYTNVTHAMSPYTVLVSDFYLSIDCSAGVVKLDFPNSPNAKQYWIVKDRTGSSSTNNITLTTPGGTVTIDGETSYLVASNYAAVNVLANATPAYEVF